MATKRLTCAFVNGVTTPGRYGDGGRGSNGLSLLVRTGKDGRAIKNWERRYRRDGKYTSRGLGSCPPVTLDQARQLANYYAHEGHPAVVRAILGATEEQLEERLTPKRIEIRAEKTFPAMNVEFPSLSSELRLPTFRQTFLEMVEVKSRGYKEGSKTEGQWKNLFNAYIPRQLADTPIADVTARDLHECAAVVWREKPATAKKLSQIMKAVFDNAVSRELIDADPWERAKKGLGRLKGTGKGRESLPHGEVGAAIRTIRETDADVSTKLAFEFLVHTAARSGEVRKATWSEIDWDTRTWTLTAARTKSERAHRIPLSNAATAVLESARKLTGGEGLIFPSDKGKVMSDSTISKLLRENNIGGTPHGMRVSFRTWAAECSDVPREIAEFALGHVEGSPAELAYRRTDYFEKRRELMQAWADYLDPPMF